MKKLCIAIDMVPMCPGKGGTGSGIWTYAATLLRSIDELNADGLEICCLIQSGSAGELSSLRNIRLVKFPSFGKNIVCRLVWNHVALPLVCLFRRFDVVHKLATETPVFCPARRVTTIHDFYYDFIFESKAANCAGLRAKAEKIYFDIMQRICCRKSDAIITVSRAIEREAVRRYPEAAGKLHTIHHGASHAGALRGSAVREARSAFNILYLAKFMPYKGQHLALDAFEALLADKPHLKNRVKLVLRGFQNDQLYYEKIRRRVAASPECDRVEVLPYRADASIGDIYAGMDAVLLLSAYEGFGLPVIEAQSAGMPVVCSDIPVLRETGGEGAVYVERSDPQAVADALLALIECGAEYRELVEKGLKNIARFSWKAAAYSTLDVYRQVTNG